MDASHKIRTIWRQPCIFKVPSCFLSTERCWIKQAVPLVPITQQVIDMLLCGCPADNTAPAPAPTHLGPAIRFLQLPSLRAALLPLNYCTPLSLSLCQVSSLFVRTRWHLPVPKNSPFLSLLLCMRTCRPIHETHTHSFRCLFHDRGIWEDGLLLQGWPFPNGVRDAWMRAVMLQAFISLNSVKHRLLSGINQHCKDLFSMKSSFHRLT